MNTKPSTMQKEIDARLVQAVGDALGPLAEAIHDARRSCVTCLNFEMSSEKCLLARKRPPAQVIAFGCDEYERDIPF